MQKLNRLVLVLLGLALAIVIIVLIGANLYLQSQGTQARIQQELSQRLGVNLHIARISVTPWGGLRLSGLTIPREPLEPGGNFLEADTLGLRLQILSLFSHRLVIKEISLVDPVVVWSQNAEGKWRLPGRETEVRESSTKQTPAPSPSIAEQTRATAAPLIEEESTTTKSAKATASSEARVRHVDLSNGNFRFLDRHGGLLANFERIDFRSNVSEPLWLRGQAKVRKVSLRDRFFLSDLQTPVHYDAAKLELPKIAASVASGQLSGSFEMEPQQADSPFNFSVKFHDLQADEIVTEAGGPRGTVQGKLEGTFQAHGKTGDPNALAGSGEIFLREGQLRQYSLLVALGQVLQIEELTQLHLEQAEAKYHVDQGAVIVDQLVLRSPNLRLSATGTIGFDGKLRLDSQLAINEKIRGQLFKPIRANFQPTSEPGLSAVDFQVSGTIDHPKSNLVEKVVGRDLKDLNSVISTFLGGSKSDRPKKKKHRDLEPAESVSPDPDAATVSPTP